MNIIKEFLSKLTNPEVIYTILGFLFPIFEVLFIIAVLIYVVLNFKSFSAFQLILFIMIVAIYNKLDSVLVVLKGEHLHGRK